MAMLVLALVAGRPAGISATAAPAPSAIGNESVSGLAVSAAYAITGLVLAATTQAAGCPSAGCPRHLWVSHDGGAGWKLAQSPPGWTGAVPTIGVDAAGRESLFAQGSGGVQRSDDSGRTWTTVGRSGNPTAAPTYGKDGSVAVIGGADYLLRGSAARPISASGGRLAETGLNFATSYPDGGSHAPALLAGLDPKTRAPVVEQCTADLACSGDSTLPAPSQFANVATLALSSSFATDGVVFAQIGETNAYKSVDGGHTFTPLAVVADTPTYTRVPMLTLPVDYREAGPDRSVYAAVLEVYQSAPVRGGPPPMRAAGGIFRSQDGGATWSNLAGQSPLAGGASAVAVAPDGRLFAGYLSGTAGTDGLLCSVDGHAWQASCPSVGHWSAAAGTGGSAAGHTGGPAGTGAGGGVAGASGASSGAGAGDTSGGGATSGGDGGSGIGAAIHGASSTAGGRLTLVVAVVVLLLLAAGAVVGAMLWRRRQGSTG